VYFHITNFGYHENVVLLLFYEIKLVVQKVGQQINQSYFARMWHQFKKGVLPHFHYNQKLLHENILFLNDVQQLILILLPTILNF
jgi:hypothetical protein